VRAGHVRLHWLLFPSLIVPFLSTALSRAREYTCDRMGLEGAGEKEGALLGLSILSVGGTFGRRLGRPALVAQQRDLNTGWMTLGQWFSTHPPLAKRLAVLDPASSTEPYSSAGGTLRALAIILCFFIVVVGGAVFAVKGISSGLGGLLGKSLAGVSSYDSSSDSSRDNGYTLPETAQEDLAAAFAQVGAVIDKEMSAGREAPEDYDGLVALWDSKKQDQAIPIDPYDGQELGYAKTATGYQLWSSGPDGHPDTEDDITFDGPQK
jgi:hypothetical protein